MNFEIPDSLNMHPDEFMRVLIEFEPSQKLYETRPASTRLHISGQLDIKSKFAQLQPERRKMNLGLYSYRPWPAEIISIIRASTTSTSASVLSKQDTF